MQENDSINTITSSSGDQVFLFDSTRTEKDSLYTGTNYSPRIIQKKWSPKYINGFETQCHRPVTDPLTDFKETSITIPIGFEATPRPHTPVHNSSIALLLITGFLLIAIFYHRGIKYLIQAFSNITEVKDRHSIFTNITVNETQLRFALLFQTFITEGIALFFLINNFWEIQSENSLSLAIIFCCLSAAVFYWIQMFIYHLLDSYSAIRHAPGNAWKFLIGQFTARSRIIPGRLMYDIYSCMYKYNALDYRHLLHFITYYLYL
ncbi:MAG: DUF4271 domain-containing protein [Barnesiella sp.]